MSIIGADVEALRQLGRKLSSLSEMCSASEAALTAALGSTEWKGPDADRFRADWQGAQASALRAAAQSLAEVSTSVVREAAEQEAASGGAGGTSTGGGLGESVTAPSSSTAEEPNQSFPTKSGIGLQGLAATIDERREDYAKRARLEQLAKLAAGGFAEPEKLLDTGFMYERAAEAAKQADTLWAKGDVAGAMRQTMSAQGWFEQAEVMNHRASDFHHTEVAGMESDLDKIRAVRDLSSIVVKTGAELMPPGASLAFGTVGNLISDGGKLLERNEANSDTVDLGRDALSVVGQSVVSAAASTAMPEAQNLAGAIASVGGSVALDQKIQELGEEQRMAFDRAKVLEYAKAHGLDAQQTAFLMPKADPDDPFGDIAPDAVAEVVKTIQRHLKVKP